MRSISKPGRGGAIEIKPGPKAAVQLKVAFDLQQYLSERAVIVERALEEAVPARPGPAAILFEAMRYSLLGGGKRLRPILALATCEAVGGRIADALALACAIEMIHTYSMVHDDLPSMDDDDLRRGKPTNHKVYGDAVATLAGDALLTDAFRVLAEAGRSRRLKPAAIAAVIEELAEAAGSGGMVAGQTLDILAAGHSAELTDLEYLHSKKTGALFLAAVRGGALLGGASSSELEALSAYGKALGLAFQVMDDILDVEASTETMGKRTHKDGARGKATYPGLIGLERSRELARELERKALAAIAGFDDRAEPLRAIARFVVEREQ